MVVGIVFDVAVGLVVKIGVTGVMGLVVGVGILTQRRPIQTAA